LPALQFKQVLDPRATWKVPAAHEVHFSAFAADDVPAAQVEQTPAPAAVLYMPALQFRQVDEPVAAW